MQTFCMCSASVIVALRPSGDTCDTHAKTTQQEVNNFIAYLSASQQGAISQLNNDTGSSFLQQIFFSGFQPHWLNFNIVTKADTA